MIAAIAAVTIAVSSVVAPALPWWATAQRSTSDSGIVPVRQAAPGGPGVTWIEVHCKHPGFRQPVCYTVVRGKHPGIRSGGIQPVRAS